MFHRLKLVIVVLLLASGTAIAESADELALRKKLEKMSPGQVPTSVSATPVPGIYEVIFDADIFYFTTDARYFFKGSLVDAVAGVNLTRNAKSAAVKKVLAGLDESDMVVFSPQNTKHTVTVFTDIDCGYCRKLHNEMGDYLERGIAIRYLAYPRSGPNTLSFDKAVDVWCADDREMEMTRAKQSKIATSELQSCQDNPVLAQWQLGRSMGINGTPTMITSDGKVIPGYLPAAKLLGALNDG